MFQHVNLGDTQATAPTLLSPWGRVQAFPLPVWTSLVGNSVLTLQPGFAAKGVNGGSPHHTAQLRTQEPHVSRRAEEKVQPQPCIC